MIVVAIVGGVGGCVGRTEPLTPSRITIVSGDNQVSPTGLAFPEPLVVSVRDQNNQAFVGATTRWAIAQGGGSLSATVVTTDEEGKASVIYTPGPAPGTARIDVTLAGVGTVTFTLAISQQGAT